MFRFLALLVLVVATAFSLNNPDPVAVRFLMWRFETTLALAVLGGAVLGGFLVFSSNMLAQQRLRAQVRELQARVRALESSPAPSGPGASTSPPR
jgi:uncharacterized integral membrane protein